MEHSFWIGLFSGAGLVLFFIVMRMLIIQFLNLRKEEIAFNEFEAKEEYVRREEAIAYSNWIQRCVGFGFPKKEDGNEMNCWELYDYFHDHSPKREIFITHANFVKPEWEKY